MKEANARGAELCAAGYCLSRKNTAEFRLISDTDALHSFLTEKAGFDLPALILGAALEDGREHARNMQTAP